jgi:ABC-type antimicrobial peptide transport system permease subunit
MAITLNNKVGVKIDTVDFSDLVTAATLNMAFEELEVTAMGDTARQYVKGLETATLTLSFLNDPATNEILDELLSNYGTTVGVKLIQDAASAVADGNKLYTFDILVNNLTPINGATGDLSSQDVTFTVNSAVTVADSGTF